MFDDFISKLTVIFLLSKRAMNHLGLTKEEGKFYCDCVFVVSFGCFLILAFINYLVLSDSFLNGIMWLISWVIIYLSIALIISLLPVKTILKLKKIVKKR